MSVKELIGQLQAMPQDADVLIGSGGLMADDARHIGHGVYITGEVSEATRAAGSVHHNTTEQFKKVAGWRANTL